MHELSLVEELVARCIGRTGGKPASLVRVRHASTVPLDGLEQAFTMLTLGGPLAGAVLEAEPFSVSLGCDCGFSGELGHDDLVSGSIACCPACGAVSTLPRTAELELVDVR